MDVISYVLNNLQNLFVLQNKTSISSRYCCVFPKDHHKRRLEKIDKMLDTKIYVYSFTFLIIILFLLLAIQFYIGVPPNLKTCIIASGILLGFLNLIAVTRIVCSNSELIEP